MSIGSKTLTFLLVGALVAVSVVSYFLGLRFLAYTAAGILVGLLGRAIWFNRRTKSKAFTEAAIWLAVLLAVALSVFTIWIQKLGKVGDRRMNVTLAYVGKIEYVPTKKIWKVNEQLSAVTVDVDKSREESGDGKLANYQATLERLSDLLTRGGWRVDPNDESKFLREKEQIAYSTILPVFTKNAIPLPDIRSAFLTIRTSWKDSTLILVAPKYAVNKTYPKYTSRDDTLEQEKELEAFSIPLTSMVADESPGVRVELISPWFRNFVGALVVGNWSVPFNTICTIFGLIFAEQFKTKVIIPIVKGLFKLFGIKYVESADTKLPPEIMAPQPDGSKETTT